jgi:hypothetical protein
LAFCQILSYATLTEKAIPLCPIIKPKYPNQG